MRLSIAAILTAATLVATTNAVSAASLQVSPVSLEIPAPGSATTITLNNPGDAPIKSQIRVFKWSMVNGEERLEPTTAVIASPPMASLKPKTDYVVRIVRTDKSPVSIEETYRLVVDEIPDRTNMPRNSIAMAFRYSVPVFFTSKMAAGPDLTWSTETVNGKTYISATNLGGRRVRVSDLSAADSRGKPTMIAKGLAGYVLARSSKSWVAPKALQNASQPLLITAQGDVGPINAQALPQPAR